MSAAGWRDDQQQQQQQRGQALPACTGRIQAAELLDTPDKREKRRKKKGHAGAGAAASKQPPRQRPGSTAAAGISSKLPGAGSAHSAQPTVAPMSLARAREFLGVEAEEAGSSDEDDEEEGLSSEDGHSEGEEEGWGDEEEEEWGEEEHEEQGYEGSELVEGGGDGGGDAAQGEAAGQRGEWLGGTRGAGRGTWHHSNCCIRFGDSRVAIPPFAAGCEGRLAIPAGADAAQPHSPGAHQEEESAVLTAEEAEVAVSFLTIPHVPQHPAGCLPPNLSLMSLLHSTCLSASALAYAPPLACVGAGGPAASPLPHPPLRQVPLRLHLPVCLLPARPQLGGAASGGSHPGRRRCQQAV